MEQKESLEILDGCLKQIESMSPEDIEAHEKEKDININWLMKEAENNKIKRILKAIIHEFGLYVQTGNFLISFDLFFYPLCLDFYSGGVVHTKEELDRVRKLLEDEIKLYDTFGGNPKNIMK